MVKCYRNSVSLSDIWVSSHEKLSDFYTSSWQPGDSAVPMLVIRLFLLVAALAIFVWSLCMAPNPYWLIFLTNWGLLLVLMTTLSGFLVSCVAASKRLSDVGELPWYVSMYWLLFNITVTIAVMITALYWILLYSPDDDDQDFWFDLATHAGNSCIAIAELLLSRTPVRYLHFYQPLGMGLWYGAFTVIYFLAGGKGADGYPFIYEILDWRQSRRTSAVLSLSAVGLLLVYAIIWGIALCRDKLTTALIRTTSHDLPHMEDVTQRIV